MRPQTPCPAGQVTVSVSPSETGLAQGTLILTLDGALPIEFITPGDRVITRRGARPVTAIRHHALEEDASRIVMSPDALGGKPSAPIVLMPDQRILVRDWRARAIWGADHATPKAAQLVDGTYVRREVGAARLMMSLCFGTPEVLYANGLELLSADKIPHEAQA